MRLVTPSLLAVLPVDVLGLICFTVLMVNLYEFVITH